MGTSGLGCRLYGILHPRQLATHGHVTTIEGAVTALNSDAGKRDESRATQSHRSDSQPWHKDRWVAPGLSAWTELHCFGHPLSLPTRVTSYS